MHAAMYFLAILLSIGGLYILSGNEFVGAAHILVYIGGILIVLLFGLMLSGKWLFPTRKPYRLQYIFAFMFSFFLFVFFFVGIQNIKWDEILLQNIFRVSKHSGSEEQALAVKLFTEYILPFEISGVLLLLAFLGAGYISHHYQTK